MNPPANMKPGTAMCAGVAMLVAITSTVNAAVYVDSPDRLWTNGIVPFVLKKAYTSGPISS